MERQISRCLLLLSGHDLYVTSVAFSPWACGRWLASGSEDKTARLWDTHSGAAGRVLIGHAGQVKSVAFSPDGCWIASACEWRIVQLWVVGTGELKADKATNTGRARGNYVAYKPDCLQVASSHVEGTIRLWDDDQQLQGFRYIVKQLRFIYKFAFSYCGHWIATAHSTSVRLCCLLGSGSAGITATGSGLRISHRGIHECRCGRCLEAR